MITIKATPEQVKADYPEIYNDFLEQLRNSKSESKNYKEEKIKWFYSWGTFGKKAKTEAERIENEMNYAKRFSLTYEERMALEESRMRVDITMEAGKYLHGDRTPKESTIPEAIFRYSRELLKKQMDTEQKNSDIPNQLVIDSIPTINEQIIRELIPPQMQQLLDQQGGMGTQNPADRRMKSFELDDILEKISATGMDSLSDEEKEFLKKQSEK